MSENNLEIESKFYVRDLTLIENRLKELNATLFVPKTFEYNLRFDDRQNSFASEHKVIRLRKSDDVRLTYKGPGEIIKGSWSRTEIELVVSDFDLAYKFLECLGYRVAAIYEKYRTIYKYEGALITLDELPFGYFVEIEAPKPEQIAMLAPILSLSPECAIPASYQGLFERVRAAKKLSVKNLTFDEFKYIKLTAEDLGVKPADLD